MYQIMLVDDELPALRYLKTIIKKHAPEFDVCAEFRDGSAALSWLKENKTCVDLLITDIRMPDMDGISLSKAARALIPSLHIVIVSGYQEFEYAHGAIEASVDDYILKPVSVSYMTALLEKTKCKLDSAISEKLGYTLTSIMNDKEYDSEFINHIFGNRNYHFALFRLGSVTYPQIPLLSASIVDPFEITDTEKPKITLISGRDEKEFIAFADADVPFEEFRSAVSRYKEMSSSPTTSIVWSPSVLPFENIGRFYNQASRLLRHCMIIGCHSEYELPEEISEQDSLYESISGSAHISATLLKRISLNLIDSNIDAIKGIFSALAAQWTEEKATQRQVYLMMQQLIHHIQSVRTGNKKSTGQIIVEADILTNNAESYEGLMNDLFSIMFKDDSSANRQLSAKDMFDYAVKSIHEKYYQPINIQTICSEVGISQTYLSRLFRKYGDTSFNAYLTKCRMENAQKMIKNNPEMPLHQISACVGYEDYAYFSKVFRQSIGLTPSQYQKQCTGED